MVSLIAAALLLIVPPQEPAPRENPPPAQKPAGRVSPVSYDSNGWPVVSDEPARRSVVPGSDGRAVDSRDGGSWSGSGRDPVQPPAAPHVEGRPVRDAGSQRTATPIASGMALGSPMLDVFQFTRSPGQFRSLGGRAIWWRITIYGSQGEVLGMRELTHTVDCAFAERDRLEYEDDGRTYGRSGGAVFAARQGFPWPTDAERGGHELALFGTHLRMPWCFGDGITYGVLSAGVVDRPGERLRSVRLERRPQGNSSLIGPELDPRPRDRFELIYEPGTGKPREFVHRFANSGLERRLLLEDWREVDGVRIPHRRIYIDEAMHQTTKLEITNIAEQQVHDRTFRLH